MQGGSDFVELSIWTSVLCSRRGIEDLLYHELQISHTSALQAADDVLHVVIDLVEQRAEDHEDDIDFR